MVRLSMAPMSRSASAVSWMEAKASLRYFLLAIASHLRQGLGLRQARDLPVVEREHFLRELLEGFQLILLDVGGPILRKSEDEERQLAAAVQDDRAEAAGCSLPFASDP